MNRTELVFAFFEFISIFSALFYLLNIRVDFRKIFFIVIGVILPTIVAFSMVEWLGIVVLILSTAIVFYLFSKNVRTFLDLLIIFLTGIIADHLAQLISNFIFAEHGIQTVNHFLFFLTTFAILVYLYKLLINKGWPKLKNSSWTFIILLFIISATIFILYFTTFTMSTDNAMSVVRMNLIIQLGYVVLIGLLFVLLYARLQRQHKMKQREIEFEQFMMYTDALEQVNRDMQKFRHDYANILQTIQGYLDTNNLEDLKSYFKQHIVTTGEHTLFKNRVLSSLDHLHLLGLKGLLATKSLQADEQGIRVTIQIPEPIEEIHMDIIDLTRIIGILMDNAIEANISASHGEIEVAFVKTDAPSILIQIRNTFQEGTVQLTDLSQEAFSTKGSERGIGLTNVRQLLHQYENALLKTEIEGSWFIQELEIFFEG